MYQMKTDIGCGEVEHFGDLDDLHLSGGNLVVVERKEGEVENVETILRPSFHVNRKKRNRMITFSFLRCAV